MICRVLCVIFAISVGAFAENWGTCPLAPPPRNLTDNKKSAGGSSGSGKGNADKVTLLVVISDTGYVCSARVLKGINKEIDRSTQKTVSKWRFKPAMKDGHPVPVVVSIDVNYRIDANGKLVSDPPPPNVTSPSQ
jgi:TonB family protein